MVHSHSFPGISRIMQLSSVLILNLQLGKMASRLDMGTVLTRSLPTRWKSRCGISTISHFTSEKAPFGKGMAFGSWRIIPPCMPGLTIKWILFVKPLKSLKCSTLVVPCKISIKVTFNCRRISGPFWGSCRPLSKNKEYKMKNFKNKWQH